MKLRFLAALSTVAVVLACSPPPKPMVNDGDAVPEFLLHDANPASTTFDTLVSPSSYRGKVSAWYFGHSS